MTELEHKLNLYLGRPLTQKEERAIFIVSGLLRQAAFRMAEEHFNLTERQQQLGQEIENFSMRAFVASWELSQSTDA